MSDRDLAAGLAEVELQQLAGSVAGALEGARPQVARPQLAQQIVKDCLAARIAQPLDLLTNPHPRKRRLVLEQPLDLGRVGSSFDARRGRGP
jgi:hypothetical protein